VLGLLGKVDFWERWEAGSWPLDWEKSGTKILVNLLNQLCCLLLQGSEDAVNSATSANEEQTIVFNFLGGDDLIIGQVLNATNHAVVKMDIATKAKVFFNSMSDIITGRSVISIEDNEDSFTGTDELIAAGKIYSFSVDKANINNAIV